MNPDDERTLTAPYGNPTEHEVRERIREGVEARVRQIEEGRQKSLVFDALRIMEKDVRARILKELLDVFGEEAGLK